jgi:hypothetical protein
MLTRLSTWSTRGRWPAIAATLLAALWAMFFLTLPFTSFPLLSRLAGGTMVAPLSVAFLFLIILFWLLPYLIRRGRLPIQTVPLLVFFGAGILSSLWALFRAIPSFRTQNILRNEIEAIITLGIGVCFALVVAVWAQDRRNLQTAFRLINWSGLAVLAWSVAQLLVFTRLHHYPLWMANIQDFVSSGRLFDNRLTGFAFEPSWLAHQLNMLYLPYWFAATLLGVTAHRRRMWKISLENGLLVVGVAVLYKSLSRVGLLAFLLMVAFVFLLVNLRFLGWVHHRFSPADGNRHLVNWKAVLISAGVMSALLFLYLGLLFGVGYVLSKVDFRMANLFNINYLRSTSLLRYANQLLLAERLTFWQTGWQIFSDYPLLGVGLGNAGFYFAGRLSAYGWALTEVRLVMYHLDALPNIKSMWVRLLAETGIVGAAFFAAWYASLWQSARIVFASADRFLRATGLFGMFVLVGILIEGFSVDTFALPYYWVSFGLLVAACQSIWAPARKTCASA